jgi:hypothetical protein
LRTGNFEERRQPVIVLFFGDIVGQEATEYLGKRLGSLSDEHRVDLVIANAENCAPDGLGMTGWQADALLAGGVDVITGGNHSWDSPDSVRALDNPRVLRPFNLAPGVPGRGSLTLDVAGEPVTVLNLADACAMKTVRATAGRFRPAFEGWTDADRQGTVIVDYHGDHVLEKADLRTDGRRRGGRRAGHAHARSHAATAHPPRRDRVRDRRGHDRSRRRGAGFRLRPLRRRHAQFGEPVRIRGARHRRRRDGPRRGTAGDRERENRATGTAELT